MHNHNISVSRSGRVFISEVLNDCISLCVPTYKNEPLSSILSKLCAKITALEDAVEDIDDGGSGGGSGNLAADNGLSLNNDGDSAQWGQVVGAAADPAQLLSNREVPFGDYSMTFNNKTGVFASITPASITFSTTNSSGTGLASMIMTADELTEIGMVVNGATGDGRIKFTGTGNTVVGYSGVRFTGGGGYFYMADLRTGGTHAIVGIGGSAMSTWNTAGETNIGQYGAGTTFFGGSTVPTAYVDVSLSTTAKASLRLRGGVDPTSPNEGDTWYNLVDGHIYSWLGGVRKQLDNDINISAGDFIQNQILLAQSPASFWIDGAGVIEDYLQIDTAGRLVEDTTGTLAVTLDTDSTTGSDFRTRILRFWDFAAPTLAASSTSYIYSQQGNFLNLHADLNLVLDAPVLALTQATILDQGGIYPIKFVGNSGASNERDYLMLYNKNIAGFNGDSTHTYISFAANRTTGGETKLGRVGTEIVDFTNAAYKGDLIFETVDASINTGTPTEYMRLKYDGRLYVNSLDTDLTPPTTSGTTMMVIADEDGLLSTLSVPTPGNPPVPISILMDAVNNNTIDNEAFAQAWEWGLLASGAALELSSNSTLANGGTSVVLDVNTSGANVNSTELTRAISISNTHTGTFSSNTGATIIVTGGDNSNVGIDLTVTKNSVNGNNIGIQAGVIGNNSVNIGVNAIVTGTGGADNTAVHASASGSAFNTALYVSSGDIRVDTLLNRTDQDVLVGMNNGANILGYITLGTGLTLAAGILSATVAGAQGIQSVLDTDNQLTSNHEIDAAGFSFSINGADDLVLEATGDSFFKLANFGAATNGDILTLVNNATGEVAWSAPGAGSSGTVTSFSAGDLSPLFTTSEATVTTTPALSFTLSNAAANTWYGNNTGGSTTPAFNTAGTFSRVNDTNVTATITGTTTSNVLNSFGVTLGWTGTLSIARGGTALSALGTASQLLRVNAGATALEYFTPAFLTTALTTLNTLTASTQTFAVGTSGSDFNISSVTATHTFNIPDASATARGLITTGAQTLAGYKTHNVSAVFNETGADSDFRVESVGNPSAIFIDASTDRTGIGTGTPLYPFDVAGNSRFQSAVGIGTAPATTAALTIGGSAWTTNGLSVNPSISSAVASNPAVVAISGTIIEAASGTHTILSGLSVSAPTVTPGLGAVTDAATVYINSATSAVVTGGANWALYIGSGSSRLNDIYQSSAATYTTGGYNALVRNITTGRYETVEPDIVTLNSQIGTTYSLVLTDKGGMVRMNNVAANTLTVPTNASVAFTIGTQILIYQEGAGQTTISPAGGVTINTADGATKLRVQHSVATLIKIATNTWVLSGDITT